MLFSSASFLFLFLPAVLLIYFVVPRRIRNAVLLAASLLFYFFGEQAYTLLLIFSSLSDWLHGLLIEKYRGRRAAKYFLVSSIIINLAMLGFFKYADFFISAFNGIFSTDIPLTGIPLPIGISFFTFQTMSYAIDVYRGEVSAERSLPNFSTYVCLFPQLVAGPIVRYADVSAELKNRRTTLEGVSHGITRFCIGLGKKVILANAVGELCGAFRDTPQPSVVFCWLNALAFALQIYFDFSGYSDMAIGLGRIFGFTFPENFDYPYMSRSATEFWRRWHMTLGRWFRDYVYIPLGGNRSGRIKWLRNLLIVWLLTGLWHGAAWNFVIWGLIFGVLIAAEKLFLGRLLERSRGFAHVYLLLAVLISFTVFNGDGLPGALADVGGMFGAGGLPFFTPHTGYYALSFCVLLIVCIIGTTPLPKLIAAKIKSARALSIIEPLAVLLLLAASIACIVDGSYNPFLYFRF